MTIYIDTANIDEIRKFMKWGIISGATTNQKIFSKEKGIDYKTRIKEILKEVHGPVSIELTKTNKSDEVLIDEAEEYSSLGTNIVIKIPMWGNGRGLKIARKLLGLVPINITCCMSLNQTILACELKAEYVSIFYNRIIDHVHKIKHNYKGREEAKKIIKDTRTFIDLNGYVTKIIVGSIRKPTDVAEAFTAGAHIVTITPKILEQLPFHPKTEETIKEFDEAWKQFCEDK